MTTPAMRPDDLPPVAARDNDQRGAVQNPNAAAKSPPPRVKKRALAGFLAAC